MSDAVEINIEKAINDDGIGNNELIGSDFDMITQNKNHISHGDDDEKKIIADLLEQSNSIQEKKNDNENNSDKKIVHIGNGEDKVNGENNLIILESEPKSKELQDAKDILPAVIENSEKKEEVKEILTAVIENSIQSTNPEKREEAKDILAAVVENSIQSDNPDKREEAKEILTAVVENAIENANSGKSNEVKDILATVVENSIQNANLDKKDEVKEVLSDIVENSIQNADPDKKAEIKEIVSEVVANSIQNADPNKKTGVKEILTEVVENSMQSNNNADKNTKSRPEVIIQDEKISEIETKTNVIEETKTKANEPAKQKSESLNASGTKTQAKPDLMSEPKEIQNAEYYLNMAKGLKEKAKPHFENKNYLDAISIYQYALRQLGPSHIGFNDPRFQEAIQMQNSLLLNMSLCYSNLGDHTRSLQIAQEVLKLDPKNCKAIFRTAVEYKHLGYMYRAYLVIKECRELKQKLEPNEPTDPGIEREYKFLYNIVNPFITESEKQTKLIASKVFGIKPKIDIEAENGVAQAPSGKFSVIRYGLYAIPSCLLGAFITKYYLTYGLKKEYSFGGGILSCISLFLAFLSDNLITKVILTALPIITAGIFYPLRDKITNY